jgi:hypothetical protein
MEMIHSGGPTRLRHDQLPVDLQDRFQWDDEEAAVVLAREARQQQERARVLAAYQDEQKKERAVAVQAATNQRITDLERRLAVVTSTVSTSRLGSSGRLGATRSLGSGSSSRYDYGRYGRYRSPSYVYSNPSNSSSERNYSRSAISYSRSDQSSPILTRVNTGTGRSSIHSAPGSVRPSRPASAPSAPPARSPTVSRCPRD